MNRYILESEYLEIIMELLGEKYKINSLIKLVFMAFCIRHEKKCSYGSRKNDVIDEFFDNLNIKLLSHPNDVEAILEVIHKMKTSGWIRIEDDDVAVLKELKDFECENNFICGCRNKNVNPICEVNKLDSKAFTEEVLRHV